MWVRETDGAANAARCVFAMLMVKRELDWLLFLCDWLVVGCLRKYVQEMLLQFLDEDLFSAFGCEPILDTEL